MLRFITNTLSAPTSSDTSIGKSLLSKCTMISTSAYILPSMLNPYIDMFNVSSQCFTITKNQNDDYIISKTMIGMFKNMDDMIVQYITDLIATAKETRFYFDHRLQEMKTVPYNDVSMRDVQIGTIIRDAFDVKNRCSVMIHGCGNVEGIQFVIRSVMASNAVFPFSVTNVDMTGSMKNILCHANSATKNTPVIISLTNMKKCYENIIEGKARNVYMVSKKSINDFYDKLENIEGLLTISFCEWSRKELHDYIVAREADGTSYQSMYRVGRIDWFIDLTDSVPILWPSE
jgi:hypothetical protein